MRKTVRGRGNGNGRTRNDRREWACGEPGMGMGLQGGGMEMEEHGMTAYPLPP
jgi:hypothetical protein